MLKEYVQAGWVQRLQGFGLWGTFHRRVCIWGRQPGGGQQQYRACWFQWFPAEEPAGTEADCLLYGSCLIGRDSSFNTWLIRRGWCDSRGRGGVGAEKWWMISDKKQYFDTFHQMWSDLAQKTTEAYDYSITLHRLGLSWAGDMCHIYRQ